jgi:hypothetical protein
VKTSNFKNPAALFALVLILSTFAACEKAPGKSSDPAKSTNPAAVVLADYDERLKSLQSFSFEATRYVMVEGKEEVRKWVMKYEAPLKAKVQVVEPIRIDVISDGSNIYEYHPMDNTAMKISLADYPPGEKRRIFETVFLGFTPDGWKAAVPEKLREVIVFAEPGAGETAVAVRAKQNKENSYSLEAHFSKDDGALMRIIALDPALKPKGTHFFLNHSTFGKLRLPMLIESKEPGGKVVMKVVVVPDSVNGKMKESDFTFNEKGVKITDAPFKLQK